MYENYYAKVVDLVVVGYGEMQAGLFGIDGIESMSDAERLEHGVYPLWYIEPEFNPLAQSVTDEFCFLVSNSFVWFTNKLEKIDIPTERVYTSYQFRGKFTLSEKQAIYQLAVTDYIVQSFLDDLRVAKYIWLDDELITLALNHLVSNNVITESRKDEILEV